MKQTVTTDIKGLTLNISFKLNKKEVTNMLEDYIEPTWGDKEIKMNIADLFSEPEILVNHLLEKKCKITVELKK